jgi:hypothetical protein
MAGGDRIGWPAVLDCADIAVAVAVWPGVGK